MVFSTAHLAVGQLLLGLFISSPTASAVSIPKRQASAAPTVQVLNGTYAGVYDANYHHDVFLGMPFAQPPVGNLRFNLPASLETAWNGTRNATQYSAACYGYGGGPTGNGTNYSEDCLTINVARPAGISSNASLPVLFWIYGGAFLSGSASDPTYNLSHIVAQSVEIGSPIIAVSINYRLSAWGFLWGTEVEAAGVTNLAIRDQRLALHWVQENIEAFGGDPSKVVIQGESAGGNSVGIQLTAYGGRDDGLFRGAIMESGMPVPYAPYLNATGWQPHYDAIVAGVNCTGASNTLQCLRTVPAEAINSVLSTPALSTYIYRSHIDGDIVRESATHQLRTGQFVKVPILTGNNFDEGTAIGTMGINTDEEFVEYIHAPGQLTTGTNISAETTDIIQVLYPDIPAIGIPATLVGRPAPGSPYGQQWKRSAAYGGDLCQHAPRRLTDQAWASNNVTVYNYLWNVLVNGVPPEIGATHFEEVAFVFNDVDTTPFQNEPPTYAQLSTLMTRMWVSFAAHLDPNYSNSTTMRWPVYTLDNPTNFVFDANVTGLTYTASDIYRAEGIAFLADHYDSYFGR